MVPLISYCCVVLTILHGSEFIKLILWYRVIQSELFFLIITGIKFVIIELDIKLYIIVNLRRCADQVCCLWPPSSYTWASIFDIGSVFYIYPSCTKYLIKGYLTQSIYIAFVIVVKHMLARCTPGTFYIHSGSIIIWKPDNHTTNVIVAGDTYIVRKWRLLTRIRSLGTVTIMLGFIIVRICTNSHISSYTCVTHVSVTRLLSYQGVIVKTPCTSFFLLTPALVYHLI